MVVVVVVRVRVCVCVKASITDESCVRVEDGVNVILAITGVFKTEKKTFYAMAQNC